MLLFSQPFSIDNACILRGLNYKALNDGVSIFFFQVHINYPSGKQKKVLKDCDIAHIIKYLVLGMSKTAFNTAKKNEELACQLTEIVFKSIDTECQGLCKKENASILHRISPADLVDL